MGRVGFLLVGWVYFVAFGALSVLFPFGSFLDLMFLMSIYAARRGFGPWEVFVLSTVSDLLSAKALGSGLLANICVFSLSKHAFKAFEPFWRVTIFVVFVATLLGLLAEGLLDALLRGERSFFPDWGLKVAFGNALFSYWLFKFNDVLLKRAGDFSE